MPDREEAPNVERTNRDQSDDGLRYLEGKSSGDQGVFLQPVGTLEDNPFPPPSVDPPSASVDVNPDLSPGTSDHGDSPQESD